MNKQSGFTLIELMIVVAIIGILAAVALPAYSDYAKRAHVAEALQVASGARMSILEYYSGNNEFPADNVTAGMDIPTDIQGNSFKSIEVKPNGIMEITFNQKVGLNKTIIMQATVNSAHGSIVWSCDGGTLEDKFRPANCR